MAGEGYIQKVGNKYSLLFDSYELSLVVILAIVGGMGNTSSSTASGEGQSSPYNSLKIPPYPHADRKMAYRSEKLEINEVICEHI